MIGSLFAIAVPAAADSGDEPRYEAFYIPSDPLPPGAPGDLIRSEPSRLVLEPSGELGAIMATGTRIMYRSTDARGNPIAVTGTYLEPYNDWPGRGPRPLIVYAPSTQGQGNQCAPSRMFNQGIHYTGGWDIMVNYEEVFIATMVARGFAVVMTDYEGLRTPSMRRQQLAGISPSRFTPVTTVVDLDAHRPKDLVERRFDRGELNAVWTSDITYLSTGQGWLYLCAVRDGCSRRVLGWAVEDHMRTDLVTSALSMAVTMRGQLPGQVIFHADRGAQYTSGQLARLARRHQLAQSVGRTGVCWDNAQAESFWSTLKSEFYNRYTWPSKIAAKLAVATAIERVYNRRRRHSKIGMFTPVQFEYRHAQTAQSA
ncbi:IS3 family transposase [Mycobacteroides chelonae]|uniref:IS3 family transposase n=1 Tax=Mycobacteroides chelonae TaxID=1774 RepID=UPI001E3C628B|nr:IS3 family transposase [Mycobacteroides chelonae]